MAIRDERTPEEIAIWDAILKLVDSLPDGRGGTSRSRGRFVKGYGDSVETGPYERFSATSEFKQYNVRGDGVDDVYDIEVTVTKRHSTDDTYWNQQLADRENAIVINGVHYRVGSRNRVQGPFKGFGGRRFDVQMLDGGAILHIDDLWHQGPIPPKFRELLPDNARWINPDQEPFK
jgi:hypothetical protein